MALWGVWHRSTLAYRHVLRSCASHCLPLPACLPAFASRCTLPACLPLPARLPTFAYHCLPAFPVLG